MTTNGYKSYAHLFYTKKKIQKHKNHSNQNWLLTGEVDKTVYIVSKINKVKNLQSQPDIQEIYRKNGFVFFKRE